MHDPRPLCSLARTHVLPPAVAGTRGETSSDVGGYNTHACCQGSPPPPATASLAAAKLTFLPHRDFRLPFSHWPLSSHHAHLVHAPSGLFSFGGNGRQGLRVPSHLARALLSLQFLSSDYFLPYRPGFRARGESASARAVSPPLPARVLSTSRPGSSLLAAPFKRRWVPASVFSAPPPLAYSLPRFHRLLPSRAASPLLLHRRPRHCGSFGRRRDPKSQVADADLGKARPL